MMRIATRLLLFLFVLFSSCSYGQRCDSIAWSAHRDLKWRYFKGSPDRNVAANALSEIHLFYHFEATYKMAKFRFTCHFSTCKSWVKVATSRKLLEHEQGHFDLAEYFKRLLVKEILNQHFTSANIVEKVESAGTLVNRLRRETDALYDLETNHSLNEDKQKEWEKKIHKLLKQVDDYDKENYLVSLN